MRLNDLEFNVEVDGSGPPVVLLHGFTGSLRSWDGVRPALASVAQLVCIDLIGHGRSAAPADPARYSLEWSCRDLLALLDGLGLRQVDVLGYSMGGRIALYLAVHAPERVRRLVLESASPGIEDAAERERRVASDAALATRILDGPLEAFVADWERQALLAPAPHVSAEIRAEHHAQRLDNRPLGLANSLRGMGAGQQAPLWSSLPGLRLPVALIVGQRDSRYTRLAERAQALLPTSTLTVVTEAGHTVHVDQPGEFTRAVRVALEAKLTPDAERC